MSIDPINQINAVDGLSKVFNSSSVSSKAEIPFKSFLTDALDNVKETAGSFDVEMEKLATGQTDDLHDITIASTKYSMAVDLFVQIRNKSLDAFNQIMNMNI